MADPKRRYRLNPEFDSVLTVHRESIKDAALVYLLISNRPISYKAGTSRIAYVGETENSVHRIAQSAAYRLKKASDELRGCKRLDAYVVWAAGRQGMKKKTLSKKMQDGFLIVFRDLFGEVPKLNTQGKGIKPTNEFELFAKASFEKTLRLYS